MIRQTDKQVKVKGFLMGTIGCIILAFFFSSDHWIKSSLIASGVGLSLHSLIYLFEKMKGGKDD